MSWIVRWNPAQASNPYWGGNDAGWRDHQREAKRFESREEAEAETEGWHSPAFKIVRLRRRRAPTLSEQELAKLLGVKYRPSAQMTLTVELDLAQFHKAGEVEGLGQMHVISNGYRIGSVSEWSVSYR